MNLMDVYLQNYQMTRYDVSKKSGVSQQTLYSANKKGASSYSGKVLMALASATGETAGQVLDHLINIEREEQLHCVNSYEELEQVLEENMSKFKVSTCFIASFKEMVSGQLSEEERLGFELGARGAGPLLELLANQLWLFFAKSSDKKSLSLKNKLLSLYKIKLLANGTAIISLKSLDYGIRGSTDRKYH